MTTIIHRIILVTLIGAMVNYPINASQEPTLPSCSEQCSCSSTNRTSGGLCLDNSNRHSCKGWCRLHSIKNNNS